jgi:HlyD family secretion protein
MQRFGISRRKREQGLPRTPWLVSGVAVITIMIITALLVSSCGPSAASRQQVDTVAVMRGDITARIEGSGTLTAAQTLELPFQTNGSVVQVLVDEGDTVTEGQVLARLDDRPLEREVANAEAALASARAQLAQVQQGNATEEDIAASQASVNSAEAELFKARNGNATEADIQNAQAQVRAAEANLQSVRSGNITSQDIADAEAQVRAAEASLEAARTGNITPEDIADAEAQVRSAEANLAKTERGGVTPQDIASAEAQLRSAEANLANVSDGPPADQVSTVEANLRQARENLEKTAAQASATKTTASESVEQAADDVRIAQEAYSQAYWDNQQAQSGTNPATGRSFDDDNLDEATQQREYEEALRNAELQLNQAESRLEQAKVDYENALQQEQNDVATAQAQVDDAQVQLDELLKGPDPDDVAQAQAQVDQARASLEELQAGGASEDIAQAQAQLDQARANLAKLRAGGTPTDIAQAQAQLDQARANLAKLRAGGTQTDIAQAQAQLDQNRASLGQLTAPSTEADIAAAQAQVDQARANLDALTATGTATDVQIQEAAVTQAEESLKQAQFELGYTTLRAPFGGIVTSVDILVGSVITSGTPVLTLVDRGIMHVDLTLSENDVVQVAVDQPVSLTIDSLQGWSASGTVSYVAPTAEVTNDVVTYAVQVSFPDNDPRVKVGMTANVDILTAEKRDVLLVPNSALLPKGSGQVVQVPGAEGEQPQEVEVQTGLTDGTLTEITSGLAEGQQIIELPAEPTEEGGGFLPQP